MTARPRLAAAALVMLAASSAAEAQVPVQAPPNERARKLDKVAMEDFLLIYFERAEKKLNEALGACDTDGCDPKLRARIYIHLGVVRVAANRPAEARAAFAKALSFDPEATPEPEYSSPELRRAFEATGGVLRDGPTSPSPGAIEEHNLPHTPVIEGQVRYPVPIYAGASQGAAKLVLFYQSFGRARFKKLEMKRVGAGFGVEIPCEDVVIPGPIRYHIQAVDEEGFTVGFAGSRDRPIKLELKNNIEGELPSYPGQRAPIGCFVDPCPPGLPCGEPKESGQICAGDEECAAGLACIDDRCAPVKIPSRVSGGGCAGCEVGSSRDIPAALPGALAILCAAARRRRSRR